MPLLPPQLVLRFNHGGANEDVIAMLESIKDPENASAFIDDSLTKENHGIWS